MSAAVLAARGVAAQSLDVVHTFSSSVDGLFPQAALIEAMDGNFYGTTAKGGAAGRGSVFRMSPAGIVTTYYSFPGLDSIFAEPLAPLIQAADGNLYGTTSGLRNSAPFGCTAFRLRPGGTIDVLLSLSSSSCPLSSMIQASDGYLYFAFKQTNVLSVLRVHALTGQRNDYVLGTPPFTAVGVVGPLVEAADGAFYGTTSQNGAFSQGTVFTWRPGTAMTVVHSFNGAVEGANPRSIIQGSDGNFYGTTESGGASNLGTLFKMAPDGTVTTLHAFAGGADGRAPVTPLIEAADGLFYGTASGGASDQGVVYRLTSDGTTTILHTFSGGNADGAQPEASLLQVADGTFYGTTKLGGAANAGTVFRMTPAGAVTVLYAFGATAEGTFPDARLVEVSPGHFYGTAVAGGAWGAGTVFHVTADAQSSSIHHFTGNPDGANPDAGLTRAADGNLYGTTSAGGGLGAASGSGTVFTLTSTGTTAVLHAFDGTAGASPRAPLIQTTDGTLVGTTAEGGFASLGTLFRLTTGGTFALLHEFAGSPNDGARPTAALIQAADGTVYGTTSSGGAFNRGTVFRVNAAGYSLLYSFTGGNDGSAPLAGLIQARDGLLYGTTSANGASKAGTVFRITSNGTLTTLHTFAGGRDGAFPFAGLVQATDGFLYGTTRGGGAFDAGTVFRLAPSGDVTVIAAFGFHDGAAPQADLVQSSDGALYGTTTSGGAAGQGVVFRVRLDAPPPPPPAVVASQVGGGGVRVRWTSVATAATYTVRRGVTTGGETLLLMGVQGTSVLDTTATPGRTYYYLVTAVNAAGESLTSYEVSIAAGRAVAGDFDGDATTDIAVFRPATGGWYVRQSRTLTSQGITWGGGADQPVPGDYDGDGIIDVAVFRPATGEWFVRPSSTLTLVTLVWGGGTDIPVPGDYDGDGQTDVAVFRPATGEWFVRQSSTLTLVTLVWGGGSDIPVHADYDGDGKTDVAVFRPSTGEWFVRQSSTLTLVTLVWGGGSDIPVQADYDGDGKTDVAVFRRSTGEWFVRQSSTFTLVTLVWGGGSDIPVPADYDGDGKSDVAIFRPPTGEWFVRQSSTFTLLTVVWGGAGDIPINKHP